MLEVLYNERILIIFLLSSAYVNDEVEFSFCTSQYHLETKVVCEKRRRDLLSLVEKNELAVESKWLQLG